MIRTCDTRIRNPVLYPLSYGGNIIKIIGFYLFLQFLILYTVAIYYPQF